MPSNKKRGRKAQVTVFLLIGLLLIFSSFLIFFIKSRVSEYKPPVREEVKVPPEVQPIQDYVENCVTDVTVKGLKIMGMQGGWISLTDETLSGSSFHYSSVPTESELIDFGPLRVPYWWYLKSRNDCTKDCQFSDRGRPLLKSTQQEGMRTSNDKSMEAQLDRWIQRELPACLDDFKPFAQQGMVITETGDIQPLTIVTQKDVVVEISYPLTVQRGEKIYDLDAFISIIDVPLFAMYELSTKIVNEEIAWAYIEDVTLNLIALYSGVEKPLPPFAATTFGPGGIRAPWIKTEVQEVIEELILPNYIQAIQIPNTTGYRRYRVENNAVLTNEQQGVLDMFVITILEKPYPYSVDFFYLGWPVYFDITPREGELITASTISQQSLQGLLQVFIQRYEFSYDVSFPVLVTLRDDDAFAGQGYHFQFAIETNIRDNWALTTDYQLGEPLLGEQSLFDQRNQRLSGNVTIETRDKQTKQALPGVQVMYACGARSLFVGVTSLDDEEKARITKQLPVCLNGVLTMSKQDYLDYSVVVDTKIGEELSVVVEQ
ncbi:hypothetical protein HYW21_07240 [Candidatus Woesearchaeota archaeon]|nr:hypothetical protein [Candidatus Woesearchaeota archaeon]